MAKKKEKKAAKDMSVVIDGVKYVPAPECPEKPESDCLMVTRVDVYPVKSCLMDHTKAMVNIVLNYQLILRGLRVMDGVNGLFVSYPNDPFYKGEDFRSIVCPCTKELLRTIEAAVLEKYHEEVK